ncbi:hypothetical protein [Pseudomonas sp. KU43P]|uniref:hypothetical protein n=1 Tax=Pseudomonas sp. KU43P TaxID=2487887 RepID=UPI0012A7D5D0|nr:hypothetical protein [Pseudomonas sp. KU43P]BBH46370.1 hypothetical protein KU43P_28470 [Pseudomonas sp. KU43P]
MLKQALFILPLPTLPAHALDTHQVSPEQLLDLGKLLAAHAGTHPWQQMWQRIRAEGYLRAQEQQPHFTVEQARLPELARQGLDQAEHVEALNSTVARYRRHFPDLVIGIQAKQALNAPCLEVDWRTLLQGMADHAAPYLGSARLLNSYPCN